MSVGRKEIPNGKVSDCIYCEGLKVHWGKDCPACDGTGKEMVRKQLQKVYNAKNGKSIHYNIIK